MEQSAWRYFSIVFSAVLVCICFTNPALSQHQNTKSVQLAERFRGTTPDSHIIKDGKARYAVLSPHIIRLEYAPSGQFEDRPTFHILNRQFSDPSYTTELKGNWRVIRTTALEFKYKTGSGPFSVKNTEVNVFINGDTLDVNPRWNNYQCNFGQICEAETATLFNPEVASSTHIRGDWVSTQHLNYTGTGYVNAFTNTGSSIQWSVDQVPESREYKLYLRYSAPSGFSGIEMSVNGTIEDTLSLPTTVDAANWQTFSLPVSLQEGASQITLSYVGTETSSEIHIDHAGFFYPDSSGPDYTPVTYSGNLGGWDRGLGNISGEIPLHDGLLSREGWYLLDDTKTPTWTSENQWVKARERPDSYQDTYLFAYGHRYKKALKSFADLTGHPPLLPRWSFGILFSRNHPYGAEDFTERIVPNQHDNNIPLDGLIIDTDFKAPDDWNGWNWREDLFPNPEQFLSWSEQQGLHVALNIHPSINHNDPQYPLADSLANGLVDARGECPRWQGMQEPCSVWNWGSPAHNRSYFKLHKRFEKQGVDFWWLDWCCDGSRVTMDGLTPDAWINQQYAQHMERQGKRGFSLSRIGSKWQNQNTTTPGPWAEHRNSIHFTGDTYPTWEMLKFQSYFTTSEGNIGMPYVSHDIGSYHAGGPRADEISDQMYIRWVQFGTFQPVFRSHGHGERLPWQFNGKARRIGTDYMRLRQQLIPYIYTEAYHSHRTGLPIARGMYLHHPDKEEAYERKYQYYFGRQLLVAPVSQPGDTVEKQVWLPSQGAWYNFFTNQRFEGGQTIELASPLSRIPVMASAGTIVPMGPYMDHVGQKPVSPLTLKVYTGNNGSYHLYEDRGSGKNFRSGAFLETPIKYEASDSTDSIGKLTIGAAKGKGFEGALKKRAYKIEFIGAKQPVEVKVNEQIYSESDEPSPETGHFTCHNGVLTVHLPEFSRNKPVNIWLHYE